MHVYRSRAVCLHTLLGGYFSKWIKIYRQGHPLITPPAPDTSSTTTTNTTTSPLKGVPVVSDDNEDFVSQDNVAKDEDGIDTEKSQEAIAPTPPTTSEEGTPAATDVDHVSPAAQQDDDGTEQQYDEEL